MPSDIMENLLRSFLLSVSCFLIYNFGTVVHKAKLTVQGTAYLLFCNDKSWPKQPDPKNFFLTYDGNDAAEFSNSNSDKPPKVETKTIVFVRHGESTWNDTFNKGPHRSAVAFAIGFIPGLIKACLFEFYLLLAGKVDSWFYDSPLNYLGLQQVQSLAAYLSQNPKDITNNPSERRLLEILRKDRSAPESILVSSSLRRAISTVAASFQDRLRRNPDENILILPSLQEISRNPDTLSITPAHTNVQPSWIDASDKKVDFKTIFARQVDTHLHTGNKPIDTNGYKRMKEFCHVAFNSIDEEYIIVGGHSIWFRSFFREFLPRDSTHIGKKSKVVNCGAVSFILCKTYEDGAERFMIQEDSINVVYGGFTK
jgi:hypothetical protein